LLVHLVRYHVAEGLTVAMILPIVALVPVFLVGMENGEHAQLTKKNFACLLRVDLEIQVLVLQVHLDLLRQSVPIHRIGSHLDYVDQRLEYPLEKEKMD
jgi:hypothetical protein